MNKAKIIDKKCERNIKIERKILSHLKHSFIVNMVCAFQDYDNLYLVMDLMLGGDLRFQLCNNIIFSENQISNNNFLIKLIYFRIFCCLHYNCFRIYTFKKYNSSRFKT